MSAKHDHAMVDRLLLEQHEYNPLELLLALGRLDYADYEAWRSGKLPVLEEALLGNPERVRALLSECAQYAQALRLTPKDSVCAGWGPARGQTLRYASSPQNESLYATVFVRAHDSPQMDLFMDAGAAPLVKGIIDGLLQRNIDEAERLLERLFERDPGHRQLGALERLLAAQRHEESSPPGAAARRVLDLRDNVTPLANEVLGARARDFLAPLWKRLAVALADVPFDPAAPDIHASYAYFQAMDWRAVCESITREAGWNTNVDLALRNARAWSRRMRPEQAIPAWFEAFWRFPRATALVLDEQNTFEPQLLADWRRFRDLDPELAPAHFPAWCLIADQTLVAVAPNKAPELGHATDVYDLLRELIAHAPKGMAVEGGVLKLRARLRELDVDLFSYYLRAATATRR